MTPATFHKLAFSLWGEAWRPKLRALLEAHGVRCRSPQTLWNWQHGRHRVPAQVAEILKHEKRRRRST